MPRPCWQRTDQGSNPRNHYQESDLLTEQTKHIRVSYTTVLLQVFYKVLQSLGINKHNINKYFYMKFIILVNNLCTHSYLTQYALDIFWTWQVSDPSKPHVEWGVPRTYQPGGVGAAWSRRQQRPLPSSSHPMVPPSVSSHDQPCRTASGQHTACGGTVGTSATWDWQPGRASMSVGVGQGLAKQDAIGWLLLRSLPENDI